MEKKFYVAVKAIIFYNERFLLIKRSEKARGDYNYWEFPGGRLEFGESPEDALLREIKEEVGISVELICPISAWSFLKDENTHITGITFLCEVDAPFVRLSEEHNEYAWVTHGELSGYNVYPGIKDNFKKIGIDGIYSKLRG